MTATTTSADALAIILAAGKGTRMASSKAKVLHELQGRPLITHVLNACKTAGITSTLVVVGYQGEAVEAVVAPWGSICVTQDVQQGTGHAVRCCEHEVRCQANVTTVLVLCGDCPLVPPTLISQVLALHRASGAACTAVAARLKDPARYGRMITDAHGHLARIVEYKDASEVERRVQLINSGIYAFSVDALFTSLTRITPNNAQGEYYLTDVVSVLVLGGKKVELVITDDADAVLGINTPQELAHAQQILPLRMQQSQ